MKNCNKKILAQYLYDLAKESKSEFIEISKDSELIKIAEKMNLVVPSPDIAILKTIYARTDVPNRNNIVLPKEAAKKALPTLVGKQANWSHLGKNYICGWILDAKLEKDLIVTYIAIYKSLFPEEFEKMKEMVKENKMAVSFEIWNKDENGNSVLHDLGNGIKSIDPIIYHGVGILIEGETPACKEAYAEKLLATANKKIIDEAEKITNEVFNQDLVFATLVIEELICINCGKCNCGKEVKVIIKQIESKEWICPYCDKEIGEKELFLDEKTNKWYHRPCQEKGEIILPKETAKDKEDKVMIKCEKCGKEFESSAEEKICVECTSLPKEESKTQLPEEIKAEVKPEETKPVDAGAETKPEEPKAEVTPEVKAQELETIVPKIVAKVTRIYSDLFVDTYSADGTMSGTSEGKSSFKKITEYTDGTKDEVTGESEYKNKYNLAELEEKVNAAKIEKDAEIATLKTEQERILLEKDTEITTMKQELGTKDQEINELKGIKKEQEDNSQPSLDVGEVNSADAYKTKRESIDRRAFGEKK